MWLVSVPLLTTGGVCLDSTPIGVLNVPVGAGSTATKKLRLIRKSHEKYL